MYIIQTTHYYDGEELLTDTFGIVETEEEAKEIISSFPFIGVWGYKLGYTEISDNRKEINEILAERNEKERKRAIEDLEWKLEYYKNALEYNDNAIKVLRAAKEFFDKYNLTEIESDALINLIPEMHKASLETGLPISFYDGKYNYKSDGTIDTNCERFPDYLPTIYVNVKSGLYSYYHYANGKHYNIDKDIEMIEKVYDDFRSYIKEITDKLEFATTWKFSA